MDANDIKGIENICDSETLFQLGENYWEGKNGVAQNYEKAVECYTKAADAGHVGAIYSLGYCYANGMGINQDLEAADKLLSYAADQGNINAVSTLGRYLYWGDNLPVDKARGFRYLKYAADHGDADSMALVGDDYVSGIGSYEGWGPAKDMAVGKEYLDKACELGSSVGLFLAANKYRHGFDGFPEELEYGTQLLKKAAEAGHPYAQLQYAIACWNGEGVAKNEQEYARWLRESAENKNDEAIIRWAWTRFTGIIDGVRCNSQQELDEARNLMETALMNGNDFMNQPEIKSFMEELRNEELRLGRRLNTNDLYGNQEQFSASNNYSNGSSSGGCYIATAVYGSYDCPQVWTLRRFRDFFLAKKWYGRAFIKFYYAVSPTVVRFFGDTNVFQSYFRKRLDKFVSELKDHGYGDKPYYDR